MRYTIFKQPSPCAIVGKYINQIYNYVAGSSVSWVVEGGEFQNRDDWKKHSRSAFMGELYYLYFIHLRMQFVHEFTITIRDCTTSAVATISIVSGASHCRANAIAFTRPLTLFFWNVPCRTCVHVCVMRRRKTVGGLVSGEEDRMTMKTSDLPVCLHYILLCCSVCPNAATISPTSHTTLFHHHHQPLYPERIRVGGGLADRR